MQYSDDQKKSIIEGFLSIFTRIESKEFQKRVWIQGGGPNECDDFDDTVNDFFGECDSIITNYKEFGINENQCQLLIKFRQVFQQFSDQNNWPPFFIDTPEWNRINKMAEEVLQAFNYKERRR